MFSPIVKESLGNFWVLPRDSIQPCVLAILSKKRLYQPLSFCCKSDSGFKLPFVSSCKSCCDYNTSSSWLFLCELLGNSDSRLQCTSRQSVMQRWFRIAIDATTHNANSLFICSACHISKAGIYAVPCSILGLGDIVVYCVYTSQDWTNWSVPWIR
jgi:hypothetical protein